jgi:hypothetical protein
MGAYCRGLLRFTAARRSKHPPTYAMIDGRTASLSVLPKPARTSLL